MFMRHILHAPPAYARPSPKIPRALPPSMFWPEGLPARVQRFRPNAAPAQLKITCPLSIFRRTTSHISPCLRTCLPLVKTIPYPGTARRTGGGVSTHGSGPAPTTRKDTGTTRGAHINVVLGSVARTVSAGVHALLILLPAVLSRFNAAGTRTVRARGRRRSWVEDELISITDNMLPGDARQIAFLAVAIADCAGISRGHVHGADNQAVRPYAFKRVWPGGQGNLAEAQAHDRCGEKNHFHSMSSFGREGYSSGYVAYTQK